MTQELIDLRTSILEGRYADALAIADELEGMSKQAILRNIESFLVKVLIHLIKNQIEQRLTNSWVASISDSLRQIQKLNLKENKTSYYIKQDEWEPFLEEAIEAAICPASVEVMDGAYNSLFGVYGNYCNNYWRLQPTSLYAREENTYSLPNTRPISPKTRPKPQTPKNTGEAASRE